jgi:16S rRNA (guanine966-N2)-methyltransferase
MQRRSSKASASQLRIIGGQWRGRKLSFPSRPGLRPTADRVRETLFNWLSPQLIGARCLDLFAGSGALGIEALSRGAAHCDFIDSDTVTLRAIEQHLLTLDARDRASVICGAATDQLNLAKTTWDIVFVDPPFDCGLGYPALSQLVEKRCLHSESLVYFETRRSQAESVPEVAYEVLRDKTAGDVRYRLFKPV